MGAGGMPGGGPSMGSAVPHGMGGGMGGVQNATLMGGAVPGPPGIRGNGSQQHVGGPVVPPGGPSVNHASGKMQHTQGGTGMGKPGMAMNQGQVKALGLSCLDSTWGNGLCGSGTV